MLVGGYGTSCKPHVARRDRRNRHRWSSAATTRTSRGRAVNEAAYTRATSRPRVRRTSPRWLVAAVSVRKTASGAALTPVTTAHRARGQGAVGVTATLQSLHRRVDSLFVSAPPSSRGNRWRADRVLEWMAGWGDHLRLEGATALRRRAGAPVAPSCKRVLHRSPQESELPRVSVALLASTGPALRRLHDTTRGRGAPGARRRDPAMLATGSDPPAGERLSSPSAIENAWVRSCRAERVLPMTVCRSGAIVELEVEVSDVSCVGTSRLTHWAGCILQAAHRPVAELGFAPVWKHPETGAETKLDVFISRWFHGSHAHRYGCRAALTWQRSNDTPAPALDAFHAAS